MVTYEGTRAYNRVTPALLRKLGFEELVAGSEEEYVAKAVRLVDDDYRRDVSRRLRAIDLKASVFETDEPKYFCEAINYLVRHHDALREDRSREPIRIER